MSSAVTIETADKQLAVSEVTGVLQYFDRSAQMLSVQVPNTIEGVGDSYRRFFIEDKKVDELASQIENLGISQGKGVIVESWLGEGCHKGTRDMRMWAVGIRNQI